ncbi:hypothetical protein [Erythrobacter sp.]|jgi:hypothetical protein|uniref:hypothetical protein n=1 Tax=Erythrobacter sp. TaxID=1042 RepID=UPI002EB42A54|nr:hypothetical protein [Erythrobacter sp.]
MTTPIQEMSKLTGERRQADMAPELHNDEQKDRMSQAQFVAAQAKDHEHKAAGSTESLEVDASGNKVAPGNKNDLIDEMRDMEDTGKIDNGAYAGEPNHDDNTKKYK